MAVKKCKTVFYSIFGFILVVSFSQFFGGTASAAPAVNIQKRIMDKAIYQGVYKCYTSTGMLRQSINLRDYNDMGSLMGENAGHANFVNLVSGGHDGLMGRMIDNGVLRYNEGDDSISCRQLFVGRSDGNGDNHGILEATNNEAPDKSNTNAVIEFIENMGYDVTETVGGGVCYTAMFNKGFGDNVTVVQSSNKICQREDGSLYSEPNNTEGDVLFGVLDGELCLSFRGSGEGSVGGGCGDLVDNNGDSTDILNPNTLDSTIKTICPRGVCVVMNGSSSTTGAQTYKFIDNTTSVVAQDSLDNRSAHFPGYPEHGSSIAAARRAINFLSGGQMGEDLGLSRPEKRILYQEYLTSYYEYEIDCENEHLNAGVIWWFDNATGEVKKCSISREGSGLERTVHAVDDSGMFEGDIDANGIIAYLNSMTNELYSEEELAEMGDVASGAREFEETSDCRGMGAGRSLGWILCPILELIGDGAEGIYDNMVAPMLEIKSYLFNGQDTATYSAWSTFRDIANVMFVIVLLVVIFSQVTGIGIDNYGIKRILPKLIVCIVLINMSYLICAILIDLSNILGNGLRLMFDNLGLDVGNIMITQPAEAYPAGSSAGSGFASAAGSGLVGVTLLVGFASMVGAIWSVTIGPMVLISLLFAGLGVLISIVFTFFLLGARQSAIVVLVTVSPVIVLLSALPNTKSLYNRFVKMFQILLFVYPIMGLLVGGGNYVSKLLLLAAPGEFYMALTAMVVGIVPIFFLPSLLKEAMAALPKVGQMLSGLGDKARGLSTRAQGALLKSEGVKGLERESQLSHARGLVKRLKGRSNLSNAQKMRLLSAASTMKKLENENKVANIFAAKERYRDNKVGLERDARTALLNGDTENAEALLGAMTELHGAKSTAGFVSQFYAKEGKNLDTEGLRKGIGAVKEHVTSNPGIMKELKEDNKDILSMVVSGGINKEGKPDSLSYFTREEAKKNKMEHWVTQSNEALQRAAASGVLGSEKAQSILDANNEKSSVFYNKLSDENKEYLGKIAGSGSGTGSSGTGSSGAGSSGAESSGAGGGASGSVEPVGTIESNYGGSSLNSSQSDEWRRQYAAEEQMWNTIDNARRNGGFGSSSNPRRNPPGNPPR